MNDNIKTIYLSLFRKSNFLVNIRYSPVPLIVIEEFYVCDQTVGLDERFYIITDKIEHTRTISIADWGDDYGKVLKRLDELKNAQVFRRDED